ncbi:hypothetical protein [Butyricimonas paravirosa]|uniref:hypothetical protein n=1 Tax=Butyricimonas paravirosa TaxID=1472417 RepID=UPI00210C3F32|nr:hypothetical protein [Butyricimonas paravirosa]MCQ4873751.1 hypothetical protein [Butyricimonas paravirosa]
MNNKVFVASTLANDPHTEGLHNAGRIARMAGIKTILLEPSVSLDMLCEVIKENQPRYIGLSYRLSPRVACEQLEKTLNYFVNTGLLKNSDDVKISFAGLPETIQILQKRLDLLPLKISLCNSYPNAMDRAVETVDYFEIVEKRNEIIKRIREEIEPIGIKLFDELADEVVARDNYKSVLPLPIPSIKAIESYTRRIEESSIPILRTHFGIPAPGVEPTVEGIKKIAQARVVDELSLGSSDLSQRYYGYPELFLDKKNDGGVPYKTREDLQLLYNASRCGNFPSVKPYCHVSGIVPFVDECISIGLLKGAHQAIPLFWFNELDGRGPATVRDSIREHFAGVKQLVKYGIPVEMNDPNQWSSRHAHDTIIVSSYALISAVMTMCGVRDMVLQMQFNKPKETGDYADLAKMSAGLEMAHRISQYASYPINIYRETRTGIEHLSPDMQKAKWQLARSTFLQMCMHPHVIHVVSYCEANYAARPEDIIDSSKLIRKAIEVYKQNEREISELINVPIIRERKEYLVKESSYLINEIAKFNPRYSPCSLEQLAPLLGNPDVIADSIENKLMSSPGIINQKYKSNYLTKPMKFGMIDLVDNYNNPRVLTEKERLMNKLKYND